MLLRIGITQRRETLPRVVIELYRKIRDIKRRNNNE